MNDGILGWLIVISTIVIILDFFATLYVKLYILPKVEAQLKNCKIVTDAVAFWGTSSLAGKSYRYAMVNFALTSAKSLSKKGLVDMDEVNSVSLSHRRWICIPMHVFCVSMGTAMISLALLGKLW
ncbi:hypothetical protein M2401_004229 [Pseudomonas sp. JUb42]|jgi:hypothetical protein|uniref:hypothetical protein n=1 Tax=Pseudomonas sp. JUb42 TaxID=2940611 RepID=UPI00216A596A|nr:hypothetical protein [Pseudomonas sp. JUb42]MCS3470476.1 hypothetical protein [Pseudomonas sp. JUb42]